MNRSAWIVVPATHLVIPGASIAVVLFYRGSWLPPGAIESYNFDMPVFMITLHAYRSWSEDNPDGYYQRGEHGVKQPDPDLAYRRSKFANEPPHRFTAHQKQFIIAELPDITARRDIQLHAASCTATHVHLVVSWFGQEAIIKTVAEPLAQANTISAKVKNILALLLSKEDGTTGNRWFSRGCDCTPVDDHEHLNYLLTTYLPKHLLEGGVVKVFKRDDTSS
ncbi:MAG: hypothetical protein AB8C95_11855 [Phycisphaeraceae bacterium]